jgi:hypothetical protein
MYPLWHVQDLNPPARHEQSEKRLPPSSVILSLWRRGLTNDFFNCHCISSTLIRYHHESMTPLVWITQSLSTFKAGGDAGDRPSIIYVLWSRSDAPVNIGRFQREPGDAAEVTVAGASTRMVLQPPTLCLSVRSTACAVGRARTAEPLGEPMVVCLIIYPPETRPKWESFPYGGGRNNRHAASSMGLRVKGGCCLPRLALSVPRPHAVRDYRQLPMMIAPVLLQPPRLSIPMPALA